MTERESSCVVYSAESQLRRPGQFVRGMAADMATIRQLAWRLFLRNVRGQYRQPLLGYLWVILPPLATTVVWVFLNASRIFRMEETAIPYPVYVMVGTLLWQGFVDAVSSPLSHLAASQSMLSKAKLPWEAIMVAGLGEVLFNFTVRLVLLVGVMVLFRVPVPPTVLLAPVGVLALMLLGSAIGLWLVPVGMLYPDIQRGMGIVTAFWFLVTPVVYVPPSAGPAALLVRLNPVTPLLVATRDWITGGVAGGMARFGVIAACALLLLSVGWIVLRLAVPHVIVRLSAQ